MSARSTASAAPTKTPELHARSPAETSTFIPPGTHPQTVKSDIRVCSAWATEHDRPVYTLDGACPACGAPAVNSSPAPFGPEDPYGEYRRTLKARVEQESPGPD